MITGLAGIPTASHAGGHWFESSSLHHEKTLESQWFRGFFFAFSWKKRASPLAVFWGIFGQFWGFLLQKCCKFFRPSIRCATRVCGIFADITVANFSSRLLPKCFTHFLDGLFFPALTIIMRVNTQGHIHSTVASKILHLFDVQSSFKQSCDISVSQNMCC